MPSAFKTTKKTLAELGLDEDVEEASVFVSPGEPYILLNEQMFRSAAKITCRQKLSETNAVIVKEYDECCKFSTVSNKCHLIHLTFQ